jgi:hypothetical protein
MALAACVVGSRGGSVTLNAIIAFVVALVVVVSATPKPPSCRFLRFPNGLAAGTVTTAKTKIILFY